MLNLKPQDHMESHLLIKRLEEIASSLDRSTHALALIGLGAVGLDLDRLDAYSDLDFFVIVEPGYKQAYLNDLQWLQEVSPIAYSFANTRDGYKLLFADHIFCEFAVFEPDELQHIPFAPGRIVWKQPHAPAALSQPLIAPPVPVKHDPNWLLGEALTNLLVGMARDKRGEKLSAMRFIQGFAVDRLLELADYITRAQDVPKDAFANERRFEQIYPEIARELPVFMQGYARNSESALAILDFLERNFSVNTEMAAAIRKLCAE